mmetsp:Transcript_3448/g.6473  ORF Transcript_3448/g.6473 Transcript_3448/m.6473 type:complete len:737 (+) Transcript_3448:159-2369(+)
MSNPQDELSTTTTTTTTSTTTTALNHTQLLQNMMRSHKNRNPYKDYLVLDIIGKGSIGSVEKVVRRHHSVITPHNNGGDESTEKDDGDDGAGFCTTGMFNYYCCRSVEVTTENTEKKIVPHGCWKNNVLSKLFNNHHSGISINSKDAFQPTTTTNNNDNSNQQQQQLDGSISVVSESSAFSAPSSPTIFNANHSDQLQSNSQHDLPDNHHHHHHPSSHPLRKYALKSIRLDRTLSSTKSEVSSDEAELRNEISILRSLDHPHIVHIIETYEYSNNIYMVIDLCEHGGDLYVWDPYEEYEGRSIVRQLLMAVSYMHHRGIVHRDLKYENVMFSNRDRSKLEIKLIDFGLSMKYGKSKGKFDMSVAMTDFVGTIYTMAPEVISGSYNYKCDLWSIGVMAYMLLSSQIPFSGRDMKSIARKIRWGKYNFSGRRWSKISKKGKDFISSLLVRDASARPTADQALKHPWLVAGGRGTHPSFNSNATLHRRHSSETIGGSVFGSLNNSPFQPFSSQICSSIERYSTYNWMHRLALMVIAYRYTGQETTHLRRIFTSYDVNGNGTVEVGELRNAFLLHGKYSEEEMDQLFLALDMNGSGKISWTEFLASTIETKGRISEEEFSSAFEHLDFDKNGYISTSDLREIIGRDLPQNIIDRIIDESDIIGDNKIWKDEFLALGDESTALSDMDHQRTQSVYLERSKSADDFDLMKTRSLDKMHSDPDVLDQFYVEKAKSVRKATQYT